MKRLLTFVAALGLSLVGSSIAVGSVMWGTGSPDGNYSDTSGASPVIFQFDTSTGVVGNTLSFSASNWMWISGLADSGKYLYASHDTWNIATGYADYADFKIAKIDRTTGAVLSDTSISGFLGQTYSQVNALDFKDGKLYGVENATSGSTIRGYAMEIGLDVNGDVVGATQGAFVGSYPDCGLDYHDGMWYATHWRNDSSSWIATSPDIMTTAFTSSNSTSGVGLIDGLEFDDSGRAFAVSWYTDPKKVYDVNTTTWAVTPLYDLGSQLPSSITSLDGLSEVVPEPGTLIIWSLLGAGSWLGTRVWRQRRGGPAGRQPWSNENRTAIHDIIARGAHREP